MSEDKRHGLGCRMKDRGKDQKSEFAQGDLVGFDGNRISRKVVVEVQVRRDTQIFRNEL